MSSDRFGRSLGTYSSRMPFDPRHGAKQARLSMTRFAIFYLFLNHTNRSLSFFADGPKSPHNPVVPFGESLQGRERLFVPHFGQGVSTPETDILRRIVEISTQKTVGFFSVIVR